MEADLNKDGALSIRPQQRRTPIVTPPLVCGRGLMGGVTRGIRKQPAFAAAKALALRLCFFSAGLVSWLCRVSSLGLRGRSGRCHDPARGLVPCSGAAIGWSHAHGRCPHHQLGPEAGALRDQSCEYLPRRDRSGGRTALPAVGEGTLWDRRAEAAPRISPSQLRSSVEHGRELTSQGRAARHRWVCVSVVLRSLGWKVFMQTGACGTQEWRTTSECVLDDCFPLSHSLLKSSSPLLIVKSF